MKKKKNKKNQKISNVDFGTVFTKKKYNDIVKNLNAKLTMNTGEGKGKESVEQKEHTVPSNKDPLHAETPIKKQEKQNNEKPKKQNNKKRKKRPKQKDIVNKRNEKQEVQMDEKQEVINVKNPLMKSKTKLILGKTQSMEYYREFIKPVHILFVTLLDVKKVIGMDMKNFTMSLRFSQNWSQKSTILNLKHLLLEQINDELIKSVNTNELSLSIYPKSEYYIHFPTEFELNDGEKLIDYVIDTLNPNNIFTPFQWFIRYESEIDRVRKIEDQSQAFENLEPPLQRPRFIHMTVSNHSDKPIYFKH
mmetsp:Transcript_13858/g.20976  ORF Transcript_13858/g.20976 Transcript_13858/m.20976 type:complete len:305 (+) Transcript_13858:7-921(+)